jgi:AraC-like DNA-binding protein
MPLRLDDVAADLFVGKSTLQRRLAEQGTTYSEQRRQVQILVALELLTQGRSVRTAAMSVGLSADHLCVLVTQYAHLKPRQIVRACELASRVRRWRRSVPPRSGTKLYFKQLERWKAIDIELQALLAGLEKDHPLAGWAQKVRRDAQRPDFRRRRYRGRVRAARRREDAQRAAEQKAMIEMFRRLAEARAKDEAARDRGSTAQEAVSQPSVIL